MLFQGSKRRQPKRRLHLLLQLLPLQLCLRLCRHTRRRGRRRGAHGADCEGGAARREAAEQEPVAGLKDVELSGCRREDEGAEHRERDACR